MNVPCNISIQLLFFICNLSLCLYACLYPREWLPWLLPLKEVSMTSWLCWRSPLREVFLKILLLDAKALIASRKARIYAIDVKLHITALGNARSDTGKLTSLCVRSADVQPSLYSGPSCRPLCVFNHTTIEGTYPSSQWYVVVEYMYG